MGADEGIRPAVRELFERAADRRMDGDSSAPFPGPDLGSRMARTFTPFVRARAMQASSTSSLSPRKMTSSQLLAAQMANSASYWRRPLRKMSKEAFRYSAVSLAFSAKPDGVR